MTQLDNDLTQMIILLVAIIGVGVSLALFIQNQTKESRRDMNSMRDRVSDMNSSLGSRIAWIEGLLGAFNSPPDEESVYKWRALGKAESEERN